MQPHVKYPQQGVKAVTSVSENDDFRSIHYRYVGLRIPTKVKRVCRHVLLTCRFKDLNPDEKQPVLDLIEDIGAIYKGFVKQTLNKIKEKWEAIYFLSRILSTCFFFVGNFKGCVKVIQQTRDVFGNSVSEQEDCDTTGWFQLVEACAYSFLKDHVQCIKLIHQTLRIFLRGGAQKKLDVVLLYTNLGQFYHLDSQFKKSIGCFRSAERGAKGLLTHPESEKNAVFKSMVKAVERTNLLYMAESYYHLEQFEASFQSYTSAFQVLSSSDLFDQLGRSAQNLCDSTRLLATRSPFVMGLTLSIQHMHDPLTHAVRAASLCEHTQLAETWLRYLKQLCDQTSEEDWGENNCPDKDSVLEEVALAYDVCERYEDALIMQQEVTTLRAKRLGIHHPDMALAYHNNAVTIRKFADTLTAEHKPTQWRRALALFEKALAVEQRHYDKDDDNIIVSKEHIYKVLEELKRHREAVNTINETISLLENKHPVELGRLSNLWHSRGKNLQTLGEMDDARDSLRRALACEEHHNLSTKATGFHYFEAVLLQDLIFMCKEEEHDLDILRYCAKGIALYDVLSDQDIVRTHLKLLLNFLVKRGNVHYRMTKTDIPTTHNIAQTCPYLAYHRKQLVAAFKRALHLNQLGGTPENIARSHFEMGMTYIQVSDTQKALYHVKQSAGMLLEIPGGAKLDFWEPVMKLLKEENHNLMSTFLKSTGLTPTEFQQLIPDSKEGPTKRIVERPPPMGMDSLHAGLRVCTTKKIYKSIRALPPSGVTTTMSQYSRVCQHLQDKLAVLQQQCKNSEASGNLFEKYLTHQTEVVSDLVRQLHAQTSKPPVPQGIHRIKTRQFGIFTLHET